MLGSVYIEYIVTALQECMEDRGINKIVVNDIHYAEDTLTVQIRVLKLNGVSTKNLIIHRIVIHKSSRNSLRLTAG